MMEPPIDLEAIVCRAMMDNGFFPDFPAEIDAEIEAIRKQVPVPDLDIKDLRHLEWSSIDNRESRDLDQVEWVERLPNDEFRVLVGIADVDALVQRRSQCDIHAQRNGVSVYAGVRTFPMLPLELSTALTSLNQDSDRLAIIIEFVIDKTGEVCCGKAYSALIRNKARLTYDEVGAWLEGKLATPGGNSLTCSIEQQLRLQQEASNRLMRFRKEQGALVLGGVETVPITSANHVKGFATLKENPARDIIESFMVAANVVMAQFLRERGALALRRVVRVPKRWDRIQAIASEHGVKLPDAPDPKPLSEFLMEMKARNPEGFPELSLAILKSLGAGEYVVESPGTERQGHFGLAVNDYTHSTAPNRRYADLITQRLLKCAVYQQRCVYSENELVQLARHCTERDQAARHVERFMKKVLAASWLRLRIGEKLHGIITGVSGKGTFVRVLEIPVEGRVVQGEQGMDIGAKVQVRLLGTEPEKGFIDFALCGEISGQLKC